LDYPELREAVEHMEKLDSQVRRVLLERPVILAYPELWDILDLLEILAPLGALEEPVTWVCLV
jgi:hypothetical protein